MHLLSSSQCRAARALLNWSQSDLAHVAATHVQTISNFEKDAKIPTKRTLMALQRAFEGKGIECTPDGGVRPQKSQVIVFNGIEGFRDFRNDIVNEAKSGSINVCVSNVNEHDFDHWNSQIGDDLIVYRSAMTNTKNKTFRILVKDGDTYWPASDYASYAWLPAHLFGEISFFLYGDKTAILSFEKDTFNAYVIPHKRITAFYRREFERLWSIARVVKE